MGIRRLRVLLVVLVVLLVAQAGCRTSGKDEKDTQRVDQRGRTVMWADT